MLARYLRELHRKKPSTGLLVVALFVGVASWVVGYFVLRQFPNSGDEYAYLLQSKFFAQGELAGKAFPFEVQRIFTVDHVIQTSEMRVAKYPPGWPVLLWLGGALASEWTVTPVLAGICALGFGRLLDCAGLHNSWRAVAVIVFTPFFIFNGASLHSHMASLTLLTWSTAAVLGETRTSKKVSAVLWALAFLVRPWDAAIYLVTLPILVSRRDWLAWLLPAGLGPCLFCAYNAALFGDPMLTGYDVFRRAQEVLYLDQRQAEPSFEHLASWPTHLYRVVSLWEWAPLPIIFGTIGWGGLATSTRKGRVLLWSLGSVCCIIASQLVTKSNAGDSYGPRYLFSLLLPLSVAGAAGVERVIAATARGWWLLTGAVLSISAVQIADEAQFYASQVEVRRLPFEAIEKKQLSLAIVLVGNDLADPPHWYARNADPEESILVGRNLDREGWSRLRRQYPDRPIYLFSRNDRGGGDLVKMPE